jgi:hypothetical protein
MRSTRASQRANSRLEKNFPRAQRQAVHFFTVTEYARREMVELLNIPADKITCTYTGPGRT